MKTRHFSASKKSLNPSGFFRAFQVFTLPLVVSGEVISSTKTSSKSTFWRIKDKLFMNVTKVTSVSARSENALFNLRTFSFGSETLKVFNTQRYFRKCFTVDSTEEKLRRSLQLLFFIKLCQNRTSKTQSQLQNKNKTVIYIHRYINKMTQMHNEVLSLLLRCPRQATVTFNLYSERQNIWSTPFDRE